MRLSKLLPLSVRARLMGSLVPSRRWFALAMAMGRLHARASSVLRGAPNPKLQAWIMSEHWLTALTSLKGFPVPFRFVGDLPGGPDGLRHAAGTLICSMHTPYIGVVPGALLSAGCRVNAVVADPGNIGPDGQYLSLGCPEGLPAIPADNGALVRVRTLLRAGGLLAAPIDRDKGGALSPALPQLCGRLGARVVLCWTELDLDNTIRITFADPPWPIPDTPEKVQENLARMEQERMRIFAAFGAKPEDLPEL